MFNSLQKASIWLHDIRQRHLIHFHLLSKFLNSLQTLNRPLRQLKRLAPACIHRLRAQQHNDHPRVLNRDRCAKTRARTICNACFNSCHARGTYKFMCIFPDVSSCVAWLGLGNQVTARRYYFHETVVFHADCAQFSDIERSRHV